MSRIPCRNHSTVLTDFIHTIAIGTPNVIMLLLATGVHFLSVCQLCEVIRRCLFDIGLTSPERFRCVPSFPHSNITRLAYIVNFTSFGIIGNATLGTGGISNVRGGGTIAVIGTLSSRFINLCEKPIIIIHFTTNVSDIRIAYIERRFVVGKLVVATGFVIFKGSNIIGRYIGIST